MSSRNSETFRRMLCYCGLETSFLRSRQVHSYGQYFYRCPRRLAEQCDFFRWADGQVDSTAGSDRELISLLEDSL